ncbi:MAG: rhamnulokinase, partial [Parabacteroides gordonii]|nr:rhamnulokinase [Parabacteroides gordonii]
MKKHTFLAFDIGATSGRAVLVILINGKFEMREIHRFPNNLLELHGKYYWNIYNLYEELKKSLSLCIQQQIVPASIGIDTWGVDFGF